MIDVHLCRLPDEKCTIFDNGILEKIENIEIHEHESIPDNILATRIRAFMTGNKPYVSFVDPDDVVLEDGFSPCLGVLERGKHSMVYTNSYRESDGQPLYPPNSRWHIDMHFNSFYPAHQIVVMRRDMLTYAISQIMSQDELLERGRFRDTALIYAHMVKQAPAFLLSELYSYRWNNQTGNNSRNKGLDTDNYFVLRYIRNLLWSSKSEAAY